MKSRSLALVALAALLLALPVMASPDGAAIYKTKCTTCHGADGSGQTPAGKSLESVTPVM